MNSELCHNRYFENGRKFYQGGLPVLSLHGSWFQMGRQYGALMREELEKVYRFAALHPEGFKQVGQLGRGRNIVGLHRYDELFRGMAETSCLTLEQLCIINSVEVIYLDRLSDELKEVFNGSRCSALAVSGAKARNGETLIGRSYDWLPDFETIADTIVLTAFHPADGAIPTASLNWTGCMYMTTGLNSNGVYLNLNSGLFSDSNVEPSRIHNTWLLWDFLLNSDDFDTLFTYFSTCSASAAFLIMAAQKDRTECFEWHTRGKYQLSPHDGDLLAAANHFTTPGWINDPRAASTDFASSILRRENLLKRAAEYETIGPEEMTQIMSIPADEGGLKVKGTMFQTVVSPGKQIWYVRTKAMNDWAMIPMMNILKGNGELA